MGHRRCLAVHDFAGPHHATTQRLGDTLMTEAHTQQRPPAGKKAHRLQRDARALRRAGARRYHDVAGCHGLDLGQGLCVVADHLDRLAAFTDIAGEVVGEGIVVVDQGDSHGATPCSVSISARALVSVSSYSAAGSESATMPPPAWKVSWRPRIAMVRMTM